MRLSAFLIQLLNEQIQHELTNEARYRALSSWAERLGLTGCASWLRRQADDEHGHAMQVISYMEARNERYSPLSVSFLDVEPDSLRAAFVSVYELEVATTEKLAALYEAAMAARDVLTCAWLYGADGLIIEQIHEENVAQTILDRIDARGGILSLVPTAPDTPRPAECDGSAVHDLDCWIGRL